MPKIKKSYAKFILILKKFTDCGNLKLLAKALVIAFVLAVVYSLIPFGEVCGELENDVFRLHILANSDSEADQSLKLKVRDVVLEYTEELFESANSKAEAEAAVSADLCGIIDAARQEVYAEGYGYSVSAEVTKAYFNTRVYDSYTLPAGEYDALQIVIGSGEGHNWWCVMYPSICVSSSEDGDERARGALTDDEYNVVTDKTEYKFFIFEFFRNLFNR